jgi:hypothetical protein
MDDYDSLSSRISSLEGTLGSILASRTKMAGYRQRRRRATRHGSGRSVAALVTAAQTWLPRAT